MVDRAMGMKKHQREQWGQRHRFLWGFVRGVAWSTGFSMAALIRDPWFWPFVIGRLPLLIFIETLAPAEKADQK